MTSTLGLPDNQSSMHCCIDRSYMVRSGALLRLMCAPLADAIRKAAPK